MLDAAGACENGVADARITVRVGHDPNVGLAGGGDDGFQLLPVVDLLPGIGVRQARPLGTPRLDPVHPTVEVDADEVTERVERSHLAIEAGEARVGQHRVPDVGRDVHAGGEDVGSRQLTGVHEVADGHVAVSTHPGGADGGDSGFQRAAGSAERVEV